MAVRTGSAEWKGTLEGGSGTVAFGSGEHAYEGSYSYPSRFEEGDGTNPEELIGAAHAGCFSMALAADLGGAGFEPTSIRTQATVHLEKVEGASTVTRIELSTEAEVPGIEEDDFQEQAQGAKANCPVSRALAGVEISLTAKLVA